MPKPEAATMKDKSGAIARPVGNCADLAHHRSAGTRQRIVGNKINGLLLSSPSFDASTDHRFLYSASM